MDEHALNRRQILGGLAMATGAATLLEGLGTRTASAADAPAPGVGTAQAPTITDIRDKVVYITGGSSGIGLGIARVFHEAGAKVVIGNLDDNGELVASVSEIAQMGPWPIDTVEQVLRLAQGLDPDANLQRAEGATRRCAETTKALLSFSRPASSELTSLDLNAVVRESAMLLNRGLGPAVRLELALSPGLPPVMGDPVQLEPAPAVQP